MYVNKHSKVSDEKEILDFLRANGFGILVTQQEGKLVATHLPMLLSDDGKTLSGHLARANQQWKQFTKSTEVLAVFPGPHAYISSSWYDHENVPTWNYLAVHVYGKIRVIDGEPLEQSISALVEKYEKASECPVSVAKMTPAYFQRELRAVVGFEIAIDRIEASKKLSQNRDQKNYQSIIEHLENRNEGDDHKIVTEMKKDFSKLYS